MDILASLTGAAAALPATPTSPGQPTLPGGDPAFAAMLLDAPLPGTAAVAPTGSPVAAPAAPQPGAPPLVDLAGLTPAAPDEVAVTSDPMPTAGTISTSAQPKAPIKTAAQPSAAALPIPEATEAVAAPAEPVAPTAAAPAEAIAPTRKREGKPTDKPAAAESEIKAEAAAVPPLALPVVAQDQPRPVAVKSARGASPEKPREIANEPEASPPGFARVATVPATERAAPEAAFRVEAAVPPGDAPTAAAPTPVVLPSATTPTGGAHAAAAPSQSADAARHEQPSLHLGDAFGERMGVVIARRLGEGGEELIVRMEPAELGRIHVRLSFDEQGSLRAVLAAESGSVVEALRRDAGELARALGDAGVRTDAQSFRFDRGGSGQGEQGQAAWARWQNQQAAQGRSGGDMAGAGEEIVYRPMRRNGRLDLVA